LFSRTEELEEARRDLGRARAQLEGIGKKHGIVGSSEGMRRVLALVERVQDTAIPVVIQGESGTGKELFARAIHYGGQRRKAPFIAVNCAAVPESLLESELFGHVRGAFTGADRDKKGLFAQADGGTLFLDEFADMPMRMQVDLLRVLQEGRVRPVGGEVDQAVDVRVIAASNRSLHKLLAERRLREDLYYRLSVVEIHLPALRERPDDIPLLCEHFLSRIARDLDKPAKRLSRAALQRIVESGLPGNVRQLEHLLLSASMMCDGTLIEAADLSFGGLMEAPAPSPRVQHKERPEPAVVNEPQPSAAASDWPSDVDGFKEREKQRILAALEDTGWNRAKAAQQLGMPRRTFYRRLSEFEIL
jgi:DNA-binding NtrC family response regulator